jgi:chaperonin GroEL
LTRILLDSDARRALLAGIQATARAIAPTLGPSGRGVIVHSPPAPPTLLNDGYQIARELAEQPGPNGAGARVVKESLFFLDRDLGDGTASAALLMDALVRGGFRLIQAGVPGRTLVDTLLALGTRLADEAGALSIDLPLGQAAPIVARTAAGAGDIADALAPLFLELGSDGMLDLEEGHGVGLETEVKAGTTLDATLVSRALADAAEDCLLRLERPFVLVADETIEDFGALAPVLEGFATRQKALLIVARDVSGAALQALVRNKTEAGLRVAAVKITDVVERGYEALEDLAILTGATTVSDRLGTTVAKLRPHMLGKADAVEVRAGFAKVIGGAGDAAAIERRRHELRLRIDRERDLSYDREQLQRRLARLSSGHAKVRVGGLSAPARQTRLVAARRAAAALRAARDGVVCGGGISALRLARMAVPNGSAGSDVRAAHNLLAEALRRIPLTLIANGGGDAGAERRRLEEASTAAPNGAMPEALDPVPIVAGTIRRAVSTAAALLSTDGVISA